MEPEHLTPELLTDAMGTWILSITLGPQLIALITRSTDPPSNGPRRTCSADRAPSIYSSRHAIVWVLSMLRTDVPVGLWILMDVDMTLKLLKGVLRTMRQVVESIAMDVV